MKVVTLNAQQLKALGDLASTLPFDWQIAEVEDEPGVVIGIARTRPAASQYVIGPEGEIGYYSEAARKQLGLPPMRP